MATSYRVVDVRVGAAETAGVIITGVRSPEQAAETALELKLVRSGARKDLVAKVYWEKAAGDAPSMVRLYSLVPR